MRKRNSNAVYLETLVKMLREDRTIIAYHGTTLEQAEIILRDGFKLPSLKEILRQTYNISGIGWANRNKVPRWARKQIEMEIRGRASERYNTLSFAPKEVARRWAGTGGEVLHEMVRNAEMLVSFFEEGGKTEEEYERWYDEKHSAKYYRRLGKPAILKVLLKLKPSRADREADRLESLLRYTREEGLDAFKIYDNDYVDYKIDDPEDVLNVELE